MTFELQTLTNDNDLPISVDPESGHVFLTRQLTPSDLRYFEVLVRATDDGEVQLTSNVARLVVNVISDVNRLQLSIDKAPKFLRRAGPGHGPTLPLHVETNAR